MMRKLPNFRPAAVQLPVAFLLDVEDDASW